MFQRTPNFSDAGDERASRPRRSSPPARPTTGDTARRHATRAAGVIVDVSEDLRSSVGEDERERRYRLGWEQGTLFGLASKFGDILLDKQANDTRPEFVRERIAEIVDDPDVAELLSPRDYPFGTKRPCLDTDYFATFNRDNVTLVDVRSSPIAEITPTGIRTADAHYELDAIVFATGFDAMTGPLLGPDIRGVDGVVAPRALGRGTADLPRDSPSPASPTCSRSRARAARRCSTNMMVSIEQHVDWVADCLRLPRRAQAPRRSKRHPRRSRRWVDHVNEVGNFTLYPLAELVVHGRQRARQTSRVHALHRRCRHVPRDL